MARRQPAARKVPSAHDWRTTDEEQVERRRIRAHTERFTIRNLDPSHPIFSNFRIGSPSGLDYSVEVRDLRDWCWAEGLPRVKMFLADESLECEPLALAIERLLTAPGPAA